jgi:predicted DsbA family dithiol-disulfide isomerase
MKIEVVSDVVCPWCYIGKRRLEKALALVGADARSARRRDPRSGYAVKSRRSSRSTP